MFHWRQFSWAYVRVKPVSVCGSGSAVEVDYNFCIHCGHQLSRQGVSNRQQPYFTTRTQGS